MHILFAFILTVISVSIVQSGSVSTIICAYGGSTGNGTFELSQVDKRCQAILYGTNFFNAPPSQEDTDAVNALTSAGKPVYMEYTYKDGVNWTEVMNSDPSCLDAHMKPMIDFICANKITGVVLAFLGFQEGGIPCYDTKINSMICKIKEASPSIQVGLMLSGYIAIKYPDTSLFDFSVTNEKTDFYIIDTTTAGFACGPNVTKCGRLPITTKDPDTTSLDDIRKYTLESSIDKNKIWANLADVITMPNVGELKTYSEYCKKPDETWCTETVQILYDQLKYIQSMLKGIIVSYMDYDDFDDSCGCGKFPIANTYFDAWENKPLKCCDKI